MLKPIIRIIDLVSYKPVFELTQFSRLRYTRRWQDLDDFELVFSGLSGQGERLLTSGIIPSSREYTLQIFINGVVDFEGFIETCQGDLSGSSGDNEQWMITGKGLDSILRSRVALPPSGLEHDAGTGAAETLMKAVVSHNVKTPIATGISGVTDAARAISNLLIDTDLGRGNTITYAARFQRLDEALTEIARAGGDLGYSVGLSGSSFVFYVNFGTDKSATVKFSKGLGNIEGATYRRDGVDYCSAVVVAGQGEGVARSVIGLGTASGLGRAESFVDARDLAMVAEMQSRGNALLAERSITESVEIQPKASVRPYYKTDYNLGDVVTVAVEPWGISLALRVVEAEVILTGGAADRLKITLGKSPAEFGQRLQFKYISGSGRV